MLSIFITLILCLSIIVAPSSMNAAEIKGEVYYNGMPYNGARIRLAREWGSRIPLGPPPGELEDGLSDSTGNFQFKNVKSGNYRILFISNIDDNWGSWSSITIDSEDQIKTLSLIVLTRPINIETPNNNRRKKNYPRFEGTAHVSWQAIPDVRQYVVKFHCMTPCAMRPDISTFNTQLQIDLPPGIYSISIKGYSNTGHLVADSSRPYVHSERGLFVIRDIKAESGLTYIRGSARLKDSTRLYYRPKAEEKDKWFPVNPKEDLKLIAKKGNWYLVESDISIGWIPKNYLEELNEQIASAPLEGGLY